MTAFEQYSLLLRRLRHGRGLGTLAESAEEALLEQMDPLWYAMSDPERLAINALAGDVPSAPTTLAVVDGLDWPHRRAA